MSGIYKITNSINGKIYVGKSIDIEKRWKEHIRHSRIRFQASKPLYKAFKKYGIENFKFEVIEECDICVLDEREKEHICELNCLVFNNHGYNISLGGEGATSLGEQNGMSKVTEKEVFEIREMYARGTTKKEAYKSINGKISINTFSDIWTGKTWKQVHFDVYTPENKRLQRNNFDRSNRGKLSKEDVLSIRDKKNEGKGLGEVFNLFSDHININTFYDIWYNKTFRHIQSNIEDRSVKYHSGLRKRQDGEHNPNSLFTTEEVVFILSEKDKGENLMDVYKRFQAKASYACFYNLWVRKTYKKTGEQKNGNNKCKNLQY